MQSNLYSSEHEDFRRTFRKFVEREIAPHHAAWEAQGQVPRELWRAAGEQGFLCPWLPEKYGGLGADFLYSCIIAEELGRIGAHGPAFSLHSDIVVPYLHDFGTEEQKQRWLPKCASGEIITAVAMSEPGAGSDLAAIRTSARREGEHYVVNGSKTFISNGQLCDLTVAAVKTDPAAEPPHKGVSLLVIERDHPGFVRGKRLEKVGMHAQDTSELFFEECRVPRQNLLGEEGRGFYYLMKQLQQERLIIALRAQAIAEGALEVTRRYTQERTAFGQPIAKFQHSQFALVDCATDVSLGRAFLDRLIADHVAKRDVVTQASMAKMWVSDMCWRVVDRCVQLFGGYGYMLEYPIAKFFLDARATRIFGGTNEIMRVIIAKQLGL